MFPIYESGLRNLFKIYLPLVHEWLIFDSSDTELKKIAEGLLNERPSIFEPIIFKEIEQHGRE